MHQLINRNFARYSKFLSAKLIQLTAALKQLARLANCACLLLLFALILSPQQSHAQTYPVQLNLQLQPPFSGYLPDYTTPGSEQLKIFVLFTDFTRPSYDIKLKFRLQGQGITIENPAYFYAGPFTVEPGVPLQLSGTDLAQLMAQQNLTYSGITTQQYNQRRVLPEGFYTVCVTAYDYLNPTPIQVSNEACTQAWMIISDPPLLNLPLCGSTVPEIQPQQITFSWTPLNMGGPSSALGTEYVFRLWEVRPAGNPAGNVILSSPPVDSIVTTLTVANYTQLNYPLIDGMEYVWTVQARDVGGRELFRNRGMSAPCTFVWGNTFGASAASINLNLAAQVINHRQARLTWDSVALFSSYRVEYRAQNYSPQWYNAAGTPTVTDNALRIYDLTPQRTYEARVQGIMPNGQPGAWSDVVTFTTPAEAIIACGQTSPAPSMQNFKPLTAASIGMTWQIGQFEMLVTQLQSISNAQGYYSGLGKIKMFGVVGVACSFQNIRMNEELQMVAGEVHALTDGIDNWLNQANASGMVAPEISVNTVIDNPGDIVADTAAGTVTINGQTFTYTPDEGTAIEDANGSLWVVTANGTVVFAGQTGAVPLSLIHNYINTTTGSAVFGHTNESLYGFDAHQVPAWRLYYKDVTDKKDNSVKAVSWKSLQGEKYDEVSVQLTLSNGVNADSVFFFSHTGTRYQSHGTGTTRKFYVVGGNGNDRQEIYAGYYHSPDSLVNIGKVNAISLNKQEETLHLVPLTSGNAQAPAVSAAQAILLETELNKAYAGAVVKWTVKTDAALNAQNWDSNNDGKVNVGGTGLSRYSDEMKAINSRLKARPDYSRSEHYVFVTALAPDSSWTDLEGVMPRGKNIGYVFLTPAQPGFNRTVQHELAHGVFALEHSFKGNAPAPKGTTDNLLDYTATGTRLVEWQWEWMHNPSILLGIGDGDEDDLNITAYNISEFAELKNSNGTYTFTAPSGKLITIPGNTRAVTCATLGALINKSDGEYNDSKVPVGTLAKFVVGDITYEARYLRSGSFSYFTGYFDEILPESSTEAYIDIYSFELQPQQAIAVFPIVNNNQFEGYAGRFQVPGGTTVTATNKAEGLVYGGSLCINLYSNVDSIQPQPSFFSLLSQASVIPLKQLVVNVSFYETDVLLVSGTQTPGEFMLQNLSNNSSLTDYLFCLKVISLSPEDIFVLASCQSAQLNQQQQDILTAQSVHDARLATSAYVTSEQNGNVDLADRNSKQLAMEATLLQVTQQIYSTAMDTTFVDGVVAALNANSTAETVHGLFTGMTPYNSCLFARFKLTDRIRVINKLLSNTSHWVAASNNIILDLLKTTPEHERAKLIAQGFIPNNYAWMRIIQSHADNIGSSSVLFNNADISYYGVTDVFYLIAEWTYAYWEDINPPVTSITKNVFDINGFSSFLYPAGYRPYYFGLDDETVYQSSPYELHVGEYGETGTQEYNPDGTIRLNQKYTLTDKRTYLSMPGGPQRSFTHTEVYLQDLQPFEMVRVMQYTGIQFQEVIMPAFMVVVQERDRKFEKMNDRFDNFVRHVLYDVPVVVLGVIAAPETGGTSLGLALEITTALATASAAADIAIQGIRVNDPGNASLYTAWDNYFTAVNMTAGGTAALFTIRHFGAILRALDNWNTFSQACKVPGANAGVVAEWNTLRGTSGNVAANSANALGAGYLQRLVGNTTYNFTSFRTVAANDGFIDVVLHWKNGVYVAEVETAGQLVETSIANTDLALFMNALPPGEVRLLACNSIEEAKLLSLRMNRPLVASDGWIDLYANGTITSEKAFVRLQGGNVVANLGARVSSSAAQFIRLGPSNFPTYAKNGFLVDALTIDDAFLHVESVTLNGAGRATFDAYNGLVGCHNETNFYAQTTSNGGRIEILSATPSTIPGVKNISYRVLQLDIPGNPMPGQYYGNGRTYIKTVYDPTVFSELDMKELGYYSFKDAINNNSKIDINGPRTFEGSVNGTIISGYYQEINGQKIISSWWIKI
jgi:hypothetical protein